MTKNKTDDYVVALLDLIEALGVKSACDETMEDNICVGYIDKFINRMRSYEQQGLAE